MIETDQSDADKMRSTNCEPMDHAGHIHMRLDLAEEATVQKYCDECDVVVESWGYKPGVDSVDINLNDGDSVTIEYTGGDDD